MIDEKSYIIGHNAAWRAILQRAIKELGVDDVEAEKARWILERTAAIITLRQECEDLGDNDWPDDLHLSDIIEKHLCRNVRSTLDK